MSATYEITRLGAQAGGIADTETGQVFIPFALPDERVTAARIKDRADLIAVLSASPLLGQWLERRGFCAIPEEIQVPVEIAALAKAE